jgi:hypothetical protein
MVPTVPFMFRFTMRFTPLAMNVRLLLSMNSPSLRCSMPKRPVPVTLAIIWVTWLQLAAVRMLASATASV